MIKIIIIISLFLNIFFLFFLNKKKIKKILFKSKIKTVDLEELHEIFQLNKVSKN